uniref:Putative hmg box-containing protein n=1 Tax=Xenopsylla cheopis TaxID=163159 RepID=A0A6M2DY44_XENCH
MYTGDKIVKSKRDETDHRKTKQEDLEVTGVSRSGRVRKKSSKLTDFESPDDLDPRPKKTFVKPQTPNFETHPEEISIKTEYDVQEQFSDPESEEAYDSNLENDSNVSEEESDIDLDAPDLNESQDYESGPSQSLYLQELSRKKTSTPREGKTPVKSKVQRKDKGKSRFTAYMLWAKGIRNKIVKENPSIDFSSISKKLGELWANVPNGEKYNWRRRAKRMALKVARDEDIKSDNKAQFINKSKPTKSPVTKKLDMEDLEGLSTSHISDSNLMLSPRSSSTMGSALTTQAMYKVTGSSPIDVAAYLKLLGESLSIIGERLKEHEGQIAVSGSLSVLLDSLLCSVGPLVCLSQQVPELNSELDFNDLLDNIAYVMPGL